jgi:hypothetical protein
MLHLWMDLLLEYQDTFAFVELLYLADCAIWISIYRNIGCPIPCLLQASRTPMLF